MKYLILILVFISAPLFAAQGNMDSKYVIYNVDDQTFAERDGRVRRVDWPTEDGGPLGDDFPSNLRYLEVTEDVRPTIDRDTQDISAARVIDIQNTEWRREFTVTAKSQAEIDAIAANNASNAACTAILTPENRTLLSTTVAGDFENNAQRNQRLALLSQIIACIY